MKIKKVLNNNVVIAQNANEETILMGLGLGFGKKAGEVVEDKKIEKIFALKVTSEQQNFSELLVKSFFDFMWSRNVLKIQNRLLLFLFLPGLLRLLNRILETAQIDHAYIRHIQKI